MEEKREGKGGGLEGDSKSKIDVGREGGENWVIGTGVILMGCGREGDGLRSVTAGSGGCK